MVRLVVGLLLQWLIEVQFLLFSLMWVMLCSLICVLLESVCSMMFWNCLVVCRWVWVVMVVLICWFLVVGRLFSWLDEICMFCVWMVFFMFSGVRLQLLSLLGLSQMCIVYCELKSVVLFMFFIWLMVFWILVVMQFDRLELFMLLFFEVKVSMFRKLVVDLVMVMFCCCILEGSKGVVSDSLFCICIWVVLGLVLFLKVRVMVIEFDDLLVEVMQLR